MKLFFTSDHHFFHENIIAFSCRPFTCAEEMNEVMIDIWNSFVRPEDTVVYLGDFVMGDKLKGIKEILPRLDGNKILIPGNHDRCHFVHKNFRVWERTYMDAGFNAVINSLDGVKMHVGDETVLLNHFPYEGDHTENDRYTAYRPKDEGLFLLHGHLHGTGADTDRTMDVGVDNNWNFIPVEEEYIVEWRKRWS